MTVLELGALHKRYIDLVARFKAAWTFHQFLEAVQKVFPEIQLPASSPGDFKSLYGRFKEVADNLNSSSTVRVQALLSGIDESLGRLTAILLQQDALVSPSLHRQFFQRVDSYDQAALGRILRFYVQSHEGAAWSGDELDKADFLATKMAEETTPGVAEPDWDRVRELLISVCPQPVEQTPPEGLQDLIGRVRREAEDTDNFDELRGAVQSYRQLKHGLGEAFFDPRVLVELVRTNWALRRAVQRIFQREERIIFADSERVFELEGRVPAAGELDRELLEARRALESFEQRIQEDNVRLEEVADLRRQLQTLLPRLDGEASEVAEPGPPRPVEPGRTREAGESGADGAAGRGPDEELLEEEYAQLIAALGSSQRSLGPRQASLSRELFPYGLEAREVVAYRRLAESRDCDAGLERLLLTAAALRFRLRREAEEVARSLDLSAPASESALERARRVVRLASDHAGRFAHPIDEAVASGYVTEARDLQVLRMRLLRDYADLWLLVYRSGDQIWVGE